MKMKWHLAVLMGVATGAYFARGDSAMTTPDSGGTTTVTKPADDANETETADTDAGGTQTTGTDESKPATDAQKTAALATLYGVPQQTISDMRAGGMGWGEINTSLQIAQYLVKTSTTTPPLTIDAALQQVMALRTQGMGWGQIAEHYGVKLGQLKHQDMTGASTPDGTKPPTPPTKPDKPDKPEKPDKLGKPDSPGANKPAKPETPSTARPDKPVPPSKPDKSSKPDNPGNGH